MSAAEFDPEFEALLDFLKSARGFDFSHYKRPTLMRRVHKRVDELHLPGLGEYLDYLEVHAEEFEILFNTILINVTSFFRDPLAWGYLAESVLDRMIESAGRADPIRVWSAGCATGEEAYTLAILLAERLGYEAFRSRVKIYATDIDEDALTQARTGRYLRKALENVPEGLRERYFEGNGERRSFRTELRRSLIFGRHDISRDAPISRLDLVTCRNTLMYFNAEAQAGIIQRLHYSLQPGGHLFLGRAETMLSYGGLFRPESAPYRIFAKLPRPADLPRGVDVLTNAVRPNPLAPDQPATVQLAAFQAMSLPALVVDGDGVVAAVNDAACRAFALMPADVDRPFQDLEISYRPIDLRTPIDRACTTRQVVDLVAIEHRSAEQVTTYYDIAVTPLGPDFHPTRGAVVTFTDVTHLHTLQTELKRTTEELETAYEELQSSNEELETTNEELQSTVEELETTNEELQSTNEELETTNEELRSTNEELETINDELRVRTREAADASTYLLSIINGLSVGVIVVDADRVVRTWNTISQRTWGLRSDEVVGNSIFDLDSGLPAEALRDRITECLTRPGEVEPVEIEALNRVGRTIRRRVKFTPLDRVERPGVVMLFEPVDGE